MLKEEITVKLSEHGHQLVGKVSKTQTVANNTIQYEVKLQYEKQHSALALEHLWAD